MQIKDRVFIVTGGASGLGEGTARALTARGGTSVVATLIAIVIALVLSTVGAALAG